MSETITADFAELPVRRDIRINRGRSFEERFTVSLSIEDGDPQAIDFSEATAYEVRFRDSEGTVCAFDLAEHATAGKVTVRLTPEQTATLAAGRQDWEMYFEFPTGSTDFPSGASFSLFEGVADVHSMIPAE
jgi:hypothetical protein